jgi:tetratricopeptide (TPR) repeat protein
LGDAQRQTGDPAFRETLLAAARLAQTVGDTGTLVATALANNRGPMWTNLFQVDLERVAVLEAALSAGGEADGRQRALLLSHLALERLFGGSDQDHKAIADEALALARDLGDPVALLEVLLRRFDSAFIVGHLVERRAETAEAEELADHVGDPIARFWSASNRMTAAMQSADMAELTRCVDIQSELARQIGQPTLRWRAASSRCLRALLAGDAAVAEALAEEAFNIGTETGQPDAAILHGTLLGQIRWHRGVLGEHLDVVAAAADNNPQFPMVRAALARGYAEIDREDEARALLHAQAEAGFVVDHAVRVTEVLWAEVAGRVGDRSVAEKLYEGLATWPDRCAAGNAWVFYGAVDHYLGHLATVLGRYDVAEHHFTQALALHERLEAPFHVARTKLELGRMLMARGASGDIEAARAHLEEARDLAQRCGCALVEKRANDSLGQL